MLNTLLLESQPSEASAPNLYKAVMDMCGFTEESLMVALGYLVDKKV
jgi:hypothetical protein